MSCCSSERWRGATLDLFFVGCAQDEVITDVTEPWGLCTGDDGGVSSGSECPPCSSSRTRNPDHIYTGSVSRGTDLLTIFFPGAFLPPLGGIVIKSISQGAATTAAEVLHSAISKRSSVSVEFGTDGIQRNPFPLRLVRGSSGDIYSSSGIIRARPGLIQAIWGSSGKSGVHPHQSGAHPAQSGGYPGIIRGPSGGRLGLSGAHPGYPGISGIIRASDPWLNPG